ncbi:endo-1,3-alpha-glucanase family glycosylhydrolase [Nocardioides aurantiacus]|uniref:endo-1,3-alpha-glucanase family glycosylhydrolase n=1 Tax=Nocardioides aurantiacus TaxID=86796 RepID=UPI001476CE78|nr:endo-1,3-alpha-glucanase family glycosylhydrolase [Nocardioides aurantiacus]
MASIGLLVLALLVAWTGCRPVVPGATPGGGAGATEATVWAHYFPPYPISIDDEPAESDYYTRNYLDPAGEGGRHAAYGGLLRDRPVPRSPRGEGFRLADLRTEVEQAKSAGIDGFILNVMTLDGSNWRAGVDLMQAATDVGGFQVAVSVDATASIGRADPTFVAERLAELYRSPAAARTGGVFRLDSFAAERRPTSWWQALIFGLRSAHGIRVSFTAVFLDASDSNLAAYAPFSRGFGRWGERTTRGMEAHVGDAARAHRLGRRWMSPIAVQDSRPREHIYAEASNTATLRASWRSAISGGADEVQIVTWNDYSESTHIAPSVAHGQAFLDILEWYIRWFKEGSAPTVDHDRLFLTHRNQLAAAEPPPGQAGMRPSLGPGTPVSDRAEALVFLKAPAEVAISVAGSQTSFRAEKGVSSFTVPLGPGSVMAQITRDGVTVARLRSPFTVALSPLNLDLQYYAVGTQSD